MRRRFGRREVLLALFYLPLRKLLFRPLGLDELGGVAHRKSAEFFTLGAKQRCAGAGIASVTPRVERTHPVLVSAGIVGPVLARQKRQAFVAVTLTRCGSLGTRCFDGLDGLAHAGVTLCSLLRDLCCPFR